MPLGATDFYDVLIALIAAIPSTIGAVTAYVVLVRLRTPSGTHIGKQVESVHHVALGNNYRLQRLTGELQVLPMPEAEREEAQARPPT